MRCYLVTFKAGPYPDTQGMLVYASNRSGAAAAARAAMAQHGVLIRMVAAQLDPAPFYGGPAKQQHPSRELNGRGNGGTPTPHPRHPALDSRSLVRNPP